MSTDLKLLIEGKELLCTGKDFTVWAQEVAERDDQIHGERVHTLRLIEQAQSDLLSRLSDNPSRAASAPSNNSPSNNERKFLPRLTDTEKKLLNEHEGCTCCRCFYAGHHSNTCLMKKTNSWPDSSSYVSLMEAMAKAAQPLRCLEYVKIELVSGNGLWKSGSLLAKVNNGLPVPLLLGMTFLYAAHIVIDINTRTAIDTHTCYDLLTPPTPPARIWQPEKIVPPPTPKKKRPPCITEKPATLAGYLLPTSIIALVCDRIESLSFQQLLVEKNAKLKEEFMDCFPARLPDNAGEDLPEDVYH
ncbi:hypothetical protein BDQ17DRAFT_1431205 [Cyathus striatus]|nr:hypothetical protein BDQ17DRAFT_1431205 [Cyathus striatus]